MKHLWQIVQTWLAFLKKPGDTESQGGTRRSKVCPSCSNLISNQATLCPYCHYSEPTALVQALAKPDAFITQKAWPVSVVFSISVLFYLASLALSVLYADYHPFSHGWAPKQEVLSILGASHADLTLNYAEYWRLITSPFVHANLIHILFNLFCFASIGVITLYNFGIRRFWIALAACSIMANIFSADAFFIGAKPFHATGLTSILFGLAGLHFIFLKKNHDYAAAEKIKSLLIWGHIFFFGLSWLNILPIDNFGHLGAMFAGIGLGYWYDISKSKPWVPTIERTALFLAGCFLAHGWYQIFLKVQEMLP